MWASVLPFISISTPSSDLCFTCQQLSLAAQKSFGVSYEEKLRRGEEYQEHLQRAKKERIYYNTQIAEATEKFEEWQQSKEKPLMCHCSFDFVASDVLLQADNCVGQNKNNCTMQYLVWRTMSKRDLSVKLSFMLTGHTKFSPDHFFGLFKKLYMHSSVDTIQGIATLVKQSSLKGQNIPQLICDSNGHHMVHFYNWTSFLRHFLNKFQI